jgi:hypothetical protein
MSSYAFMTAAKYEEIKAELALGIRASLDDSQYVAKLKPDQEPAGTDIKTHAETLTITQGPDWTPEDD